MPRVTLLTTNLARSGAEAQVAGGAVALRKLGWEPSVVSLLAPTAFQQELADAGIPLRSLGMRPGRPGLPGLARLVAHLNRFRPQVLHSHMFHANLAARLVRLFCPVPVVISTLHSYAESGRDSSGVRLRDWMYRLTDPMADAVVAVSKAVAERHRLSGAASSAKLRVIPNGVDTGLYRCDLERRDCVRRELGLSNRFVWLAAGRLMWKKDYVTLLRAFAGQRDSVLLIAGDGPDREPLRRLAGELGVDARFLGARLDMPGLLNAADGFVLSSVVEGLPVVLLEAAASGLPAVATDAGGTRECISEGTTGFVVPPSDCDALAAAMGRLASFSAETRVRMAHAARQLAIERFNMDQVAAEWDRTYRELLERARAWM